MLHSVLKVFNKYFDFGTSSWRCSDFIIWLVSKLTIFAKNSWTQLLYREIKAKKCPITMVSMKKPFQKFTPLEKIIYTLFLSTKISSQERKKYLFSMQLHIKFYFLLERYSPQITILTKNDYTHFALFFFSFPMSKKLLSVLP